jgi:hypothetical protein
MRAQVAQSNARATTRGATPTFSVGDSVTAALAQLGDGPMTPQRAGQVAQAIASQVAAQVAAQVAEQLLSQQPPVGIADPRNVEIPQGEKDLIRKKERTQSGKVDGWGIPRSFERDLGGTQNTVTKPRAEVESERPPTYDELEAETYKGRMLVKDPSAIRTLGDLMAVSWKQLTKPEMALLKNMGWTQQNWDTKETPAAKWPMSMATPFANLNPTQRESVRKLGFTPHDWDKRVQAFTMGKNA